MSVDASRNAGALPTNAQAAVNWPLARSAKVLKRASETARLPVLQSEQVPPTTASCSCSGVPILMKAPQAAPLAKSLSGRKASYRWRSARKRHEQG
jgi:hypothetical protein